MKHALRLGRMPASPSLKVVITMPAYKAEATLAKTIADIPAGISDQLILVDDASPDNTARLARDLGLDVHVHAENRGYGGNQKTCYTLALASRADIVVMLHPDYQYEPRAVPLLIAPILAGDADMTFGSRFAGLSDPRAGGMPMTRYVGNRVTTVVENVLLGSRFSEMHSGMRAYSRRCLLSLPFLRYSDDFLFDSQLLIDAVTSGQRVVEVPIPTRYTDESSSIGTLRSVAYVAKSVEHCARRVWSHGRRRHRTPVGRRDSRATAESWTTGDEHACILCGAMRAHRVERDEGLRECTACGLVSGEHGAAVGARQKQSAGGVRFPRWTLDAVGGYALPGTSMLVLGATDTGIPDLARAEGWRTAHLLDGAERAPVDVVLVPALGDDREAPMIGLSGLREALSPEGLVALLAPIARAESPTLDPGVPYGLRAPVLDRGLGDAGFRLVEWSRLPRDVCRDYMGWLTGTAVEQPIAFVAARPHDGQSPGAKTGRDDSALASA